MSITLSKVTLTRDWSADGTSYLKVPKEIFELVMQESDLKHPIEDACRKNIGTEKEGRSFFNGVYFLDYEGEEWEEEGPVDSDAARFVQRLKNEVEVVIDDDHDDKY